MADDPRLDPFEKEFKLYSGQKRRSTGGVEPRVLQNLAMYVGEQWVWNERGKLRNRNPRRDEAGRITEVNLVMNLIAPRQQKITGRLMASSPNYRAFPSTADPAKIAKGEIATSLLRALDQKVDEEYLRWQRWFWMMLGGVAIEHTPWRHDHVIDTVVKRDESGNPIWKHLPTGEEMTNESFQQLTFSPDPQFPPQALPEHFELATEVRPIGDVASEVRGPLNVFAPNSIRSINEMPPGQSIMFADVRLLEWVRKTWPDANISEIEKMEDFKIITTTVSETISFTNTSLRDLVPIVQGTAGIDDPDMAVVIERYEPPSTEFPPGWSLEKGAENGPGFVVAPDETFANGGRYTVFIPGQTVLRDGEIPYEDGIPAQDFHWDVAAANFWSPDWATGLTGVQKSINTLVSQIRMLGNARIFDPILMEDEVKPPNTDSPRYWPGGMRDGQPMAARLGASDIPGSYMKQLDTLVQLFNDIAGGDDLFSEPSFPGQIRGTGAVQQLQEVMDTQWGPKLRHYHDRLGRVKHQRIMRAKQFYPPVRTMRYTDSHGKVETFEFHRDDILRAGVDFTISVEPSSILPETRRERFARVAEILAGPMAGLLADSRQQGQIDWSKVAQMVEWGDVDERENKLTRDVKFARKVLQSIKEGRPVPPVLPFQNHLIFIDECEMEMNDDDFFTMLSQPTQAAIFDRYQKHQEAMQQQQQQQQQAVVDQSTIDLVRQSVQSSLAQFQGEMTKQLLQAGINPVAAGQATDQAGQVAAGAVEQPGPQGPQ